MKPSTMISDSNEKLAEDDPSASYGQVRIPNFKARKQTLAEEKYGV